jgi:hypothetical protein
MITEVNNLKLSERKIGGSEALKVTDVARDDAKRIYRTFSCNEPTVPIFSRSWWLDATAGPEQWQVSLITRAEQVIAAMPYTLQQRYGMKVISQPMLTQKLGPWFRSGEGKVSTKLTNEQNLMQELIDQLPAFDHFMQNWHYECTNWLPFCWNGFEQTTRYTYVLEELAPLERVWSGFEHNIRNECRKAERRFGLVVKDDLPIDVFLALNRMTFSRQKMRMPYCESLVRSLDAACAERGCRKVFIAVDPKGRPHAGLYTVWDENSTYGLMTGSDPALRNSGAVSLCFWAAIRHAAAVSRRFDFGGSMLEPVERFFRNFGASQVRYFNITKTPSRLLRLRLSLLRKI